MIQLLQNHRYVNYERNSLTFNLAKVGSSQSIFKFKRRPFLVPKTTCLELKSAPRTIDKCDVGQHFQPPLAYVCLALHAGRVKHAKRPILGQNQDSHILLKAPLNSPYPRVVLAKKYKFFIWIWVRFVPKIGFTAKNIHPSSGKTVCATR